jgi:hypothetical protein
MLIDCDKMSSVWNLEDAKHQRRKPIEEKAQHLWGALDRFWNSRDEEYLAGKSKVLHYTTIHSQPWQPLPERYVYLPNKVGYVWHELERSADRVGFQVFSERQPSDELGMLAQRVATEAESGKADNAPQGLRELLSEASVKTILDVALTPHHGVEPPRAGQSVTTYALLAARFDDKVFDAVVCVDQLDFLPVADVPWVVEKLLIRRQWSTQVSQLNPRVSHDGSTLEVMAPTSWWSWHFAQAGRVIRTCAEAGGAHTVAWP